MAMIASKSFSIPFLLILFICITITASVYCDSNIPSDDENAAIIDPSGSNIIFDDDEITPIIDPSGSSTSSNDKNTPVTDHSDSQMSSDHDKNTPIINLVKTYCESWRMNVELHNIRGFRHIPKECINYISKYMITQYKTDVRRATEEAMVFLNKNFQHSLDDLDAWIFDVDDTLLSTLPYYQMYHFGNNACGEEMPVLLETWMKEANAPAVEYMVELFHKIKGRGFKILLISSRKEHLTDVTVDNLAKAGYYGWDQLKLRCPADEQYSIEDYKAKQRKKFKEGGYRLYGNIGDQWSSLNGDHYATRSFKLPNPMYYEA